MASREEIKNVFSPEFLKWKSEQEPAPLSTHEATWAGPWMVTQRSEGFDVHRLGDKEPLLTTRSQEIALLLAAVLPAIGRGQRYWLSREEQKNEKTYYLMTALGESGSAEMGKLGHHCDEILTPLSLAKHLVCCPTSMAHLLQAASAEVLDRATRLMMRPD